MAGAKILNDWITVSGTGGSIIIQNEEGWVPVHNYQDAAFYCQLGGNTHTSTTTIAVQTSPTRDDAFFSAKISGGAASIAQFTSNSSTTPGVLPIAVSRWATEANQPLSRLVRWTVTFPGGTLIASVTFRIWMTLNQAGFQR